MEFTQERIDTLKKEHGEIYLITVEGKSAIFRKVKERDLSKANALSKGDGIAANRILVQELFVEGDEELKTDEDFRMPVYEKLEQLLKIKEAEIKKL